MKRRTLFSLIFLLAILSVNISVYAKKEEINTLEKLAVNKTSENKRTIEELVKIKIPSEIILDETVKILDITDYINDNIPEGTEIKVQQDIENRKLNIVINKNGTGINREIYYKIDKKNNKKCRTTRQIELAVLTVAVLVIISKLIKIHKYKNIEFIQEEIIAVYVIICISAILGTAIYADNTERAYEDKILDNLIIVSNINI